MRCDPYLMFVSIVVLGFLILSIHPSRRGENEHRIPCVCNVRQIGLACKQYAIDHQDHFPNSFLELIPDHYLRVDRIYLCPDHPPPKEQLTEKNLEQLSSYILVKNLTEKADSDMPLVIEKPYMHKDGGNVFFVDGHASWVDKKELRELYKKAGIDAEILKKKSEERSIFQKIFDYFHF